MLHTIFDVDLTIWEEKLASAVFLSEFKISEGAFKVETARKVTRVLMKLAELPPAWAREICINTLIRN